MSQDQLEPMDAIDQADKEEAILLGLMQEDDAHPNQRPTPPALLATTEDRPSDRLLVPAQGQAPAVEPAPAMATDQSVDLSSVMSALNSTLQLIIRQQNQQSTPTGTPQQHQRPNNFQYSPSGPRRPPASRRLSAFIPPKRRSSSPQPDNFEVVAPKRKTPNKEEASSATNSPTPSKTEKASIEDNPPTEPIATTRPCSFCSDRHFSFSCNAFPTFADRWARASELQKCPNCLNHKDTILCTKKQNDPSRRCRYCDRLHNLCFCPIAFPTK